MSAFINVANPEEQVQLLGYYLASMELRTSLGDAQPSKEQIESVETFSSQFQNKEKEIVFSTLLAKFSAVLVSSGDSIDANGAALVLAGLAATPELRQRLVEEITKELAFAETRLTLLSHLLPTWPVGEQAGLFVAAAQYAARAGRASAVAASPQALRAAVAAWGLSPAQLRPVLSAALLVNRTGRQAFELALWLLKTFDSATPESDAAIATALDIAVNSDDVFDVEAVLDLPVLAASKLPLCGLLKIMASGTVSDAQKWLSENSTAAVNGEAVLAKVRLLSLAGLVRNQPRVPYAKIAEALAISLDEVEPFLLRAVGSGIIEGKLNQLTQSVSITNCYVRSFGAEDWKGLSTNLASLKDRFEKILVVVKQHRAKTAPRDGGEDVVPALANMPQRAAQGRPAQESRATELRNLRAFSPLNGVASEARNLMIHTQEDQRLSYPVPFADLVSWYPLLSAELGPELAEDETLTKTDLVLFMARVLDFCREHYWTLSSVDPASCKELEARIRPIFNSLNAAMPEIVDAKKKNQLRNFLVHDEDGPKLRWALRLVNEARTYSDACEAFAARCTDRNPEEILRRAEAGKVVGLTNIGQFLHQLKSEKIKVRNDRTDRTAEDTEAWMLELVRRVPSILDLPATMAPLLVRAASNTPAELDDEAVRKSSMELVSFANMEDLPDVGALYAEAMAQLKALANA